MIRFLLVLLLMVSEVQAGGMFVSKLIPMQTPVTTIAGLPTCSTAMQGALYTVTDALSPITLASVVGGGTVVVSVLCNGTAWIVS